MTRAAQLAGAVTAQLAAFAEVAAVALGGSRAATMPDQYSDLDFYVYSAVPLSRELRYKLAQQFADQPEIDNRFGEPGDEWQDRDSGLTADIIYRTPAWIEAQLKQIIDEHAAALGYTTCLWHNVRTSTILFDRDGWFDALQRRCDVSYPDGLRRAIVAKNHPALRRSRSSYLHQIELAVYRRDLVSVQHRITGLLASYFDILFALNHRLHPGEKRLVELARRQCTRVPPRFDHHIKDLIKQGASAGQGTVEAVNRLIDGLDELLYADGLIV
jgi:hypothetical protein